MLQTKCKHSDRDLLCFSYSDVFFVVVTRDTSCCLSLAVILVLLVVSRFVVPYYMLSRV